MGANNEELVKTIRYYQDSLDKYSSNGNDYKLLSVIKKLKKLPITTSHLEDTGIGRTVNGLRKLGGEVGDAAKALVARWKEMVVQEDVKKEETDAASPEVNLHRNESVGNGHDEKENNFTDTKHKEREKHSSHRSGDDVRNSGKERSKLEKYSSGNKNISLDNKDTDSKKHCDDSSERRSSKSRHHSDSSSESEVENYDRKTHSKKYRDESDEENISTDEEKSREKQKKNTSSRSYEKKDVEEDISRKKHKYDNNNSIERHSSKRKHHSSSSESEEDSYEKKRSKSHSKSHRNNSDEENCDKRKKDTDKSSTDYKSYNKKDHRDKEKSSKKHKYEHESSKSHSSKRKHHSSSSSESEEEETYEKKYSKSDSKYRSDSSEDEDRRHSSKKESEDDRRRQKSKSSKSDKREGSSSKSKSKEKTETKFHNHSSSKPKSSSRSENSKKEIDSEGTKSSSKHKKSSHDFETNGQDKSRSKHEKESEGLKESKSHSRKHEKKDKKDRDREESKDKHAHKKDESKDKNSKDEKKEKASTSSSTKSKESSKSSSSKHKSSSEKNSKPKSETVNPTKIKHGIDSESGASFAEALGMCGSMVFSKAPSSSKKKSGSLPSPEKQSKSAPSSSYTKVEKPETTDEKYVPNLLREQPPELLPINISSLLPEITPNYKPVSFPLDSQPKRVLTQDEALSQAISNKNIRTKVYSGNKIKGGEVESLFNICVKILQDNLDAIECTGGVPYIILKPILEKATPDQLFNLEHYNPYLIEDTDELWRLHCLKEFRTKKREEMETWREMYMRCLDEREAKLNAITANIKESQDKSLPVRTTKLAYVDSVAKPPRNIAKRQAKNGIINRVPVKTSTSSKLTALATAGEASKVSVPNPGSRAVDRSSSSSSAAIKPKKAPLMAKTLSLFKNRFKR